MRTYEHCTHIGPILGAVLYIHILSFLGQCWLSGLSLMQTGFLGPCTAVAMRSQSRAARDVPCGVPTLGDALMQHVPEVPAAVLVCVLVCLCPPGN